MILAIFGSHKHIPEDYPAIYRHLLPHKIKLEKRGQCRYLSSGKVHHQGNKDYPGYPGMHHWLELDNNPRQKYMDDFARQKIIYREISEEMISVLDESGLVINNKCYFITGEKLRCLQSFFMSSIFGLILRQANTTGGRGPDFMYNVRVYKPRNDFELTDKEIKDIYNLTDEEMKFISSSVKL